MSSSSVIQPPNSIIPASSVRGATVRGVGWRARSTARAKTSDWSCRERTSALTWGFP